MAWLCVLGVSIGCSLQMPSEGDVFGGNGKNSSTTTTSGATGVAGGPIGDAGGAAGSAFGGATSDSPGGASPGGGTGPLTVGGSATTNTLSNGGQTTSLGGASTGGAGSGGTTSTSFDPNFGLVAHFPFDETQGTVAANQIDATKNATYLGTCQHPSGQIKGAVYIRNSDAKDPDWVQLPDGLLGDLTATTLAVWIQDLSPTRDGGRLFEFATSATEGFYFSPVDKNPTTSTSGSHLLGAHNGVTFVDLWTTTPITNGLSGKWQHVAVSWSASSIELFIDGASVGSKADPGVLPSAFGATTTNWLGRTLNDATWALYAEFDDLRIYNRALTATEIAQLFRLR